MPELPEVETMRKGLLSKIKGRIISKVGVFDYPGRIDLSVRKKGLARVKGIRRRAKLLIIDLSNGYSLIIHVKLTGFFHFQPRGKDFKKKITHIVFNFKDGSALLFNDVRKFGWVKIRKTKDVEKLLSGFGPEPLFREFTVKKFKEMLGERKKSKIKPLLLDQKFIAGIGNIYAQEACYCAGILPMRLAGDLKDFEVKKLHNCIVKILKLAVKHKGTSAVDYVTVEGKKGTFASKLKVYKQVKDPKGHKLTRIVLGGRGTNYCSQCQK